MFSFEIETSPFGIIHIGRAATGRAKSSVDEGQYNVCEKILGGAEIVAGFCALCSWRILRG